jgi:retron-type reverse transcriptase
MTKPFNISKNIVWEAYQKVKANGGAAGVDNESIEAFEQNLKDNLYKLWNRMSSGSYCPPPVKGVLIPKKSGGERLLGVPTVADRIAQMVAKMMLEPFLETVFHRDSYGYRPGRSAHDAIAVVRQRCWRYDWVVEFDIRKFFDSIDHKLLMRALWKHCRIPWVLLYVERWLKAPITDPKGGLTERTAGTPQGGVVSPLLANLFLHYAFDRWVSEHLHAPAVSRDALKAMRQTIRGWHIQLKNDKGLKDLSNMFNPILKGWMNYYGRFYASAMRPVWKHMNGFLERWLMPIFPWPEGFCYLVGGDHGLGEPNGSFLAAFQYSG